MSIRENLFAIRERIERAKRNGPDPRMSVRLVGVTKGVEIHRIREAVEAGLETIGENRVQEAEKKKALFDLPVEWHLVGHLQQNKARTALRLFQLIHSLDSLRLAETLEKEASRLGREIPVLLQVNIVGKKTQFGVSPEAVSEFAGRVGQFPHLKVMGLMTIGPLAEDPKKSRPFFRRLRQIKEALEKQSIRGVQMRYLSMGMTNDFEVAVEEGANLVRIGRAIFGERTA